MKLVILESPLAGATPQAVEANEDYARACILHSLRLGEAPIASHLLYTQVLDDLTPADRLLGMTAGLAWYRVAEACIVYTDRGISAGMRIGIETARLHNVPIIERSLHVPA